MWTFLLGLGIAVVVVLGLALLRAATDRALFLRRAGLALMAVFTLVGAAWVAAEAFADPGGWQAAGLVAAWLLPLLLLLAASWYRAGLALVVLSVLTAAAVGVGIWFAVDPEPWRAFEDDNGPIRAIITLVLAAPVALLGWTRPRPAGVLLIVLGVVPAALAAAGTVSGLGSLTVVGIPPALTGMLYLLADTFGKQPSTTPTMPVTAAHR